VYYLAGESRRVLEHSPHAESLRGQGWEVLYLLDPVDELVVEWVEQYRDKPLRSAAVAAPPAKSPGEGVQERQAPENRAGDLTGLCTWLKERLGEAVAEVTVSQRLTSSPACLTAQEHQPSPQLDRVLRAMGQTPSSRPRVLEVNPDHPLILGLQHRVEQAPEDPALADQAELLFGYALLAEGSELPDPVRFTRLLADTMARAVAAVPAVEEAPPAPGKDTRPTED
jgi:molecular chaperone HtpG